MSDDLFVDPEALLSIGDALHDEAEALDGSAGSIPAADAGAMSGAIEAAVGDLLSGVVLLAGALGSTADALRSTALDFHRTDQEQAEHLARILSPGMSAHQVSDRVERAQRSDELAMARFLLPDQPEVAERAVLATPTPWERVARRLAGGAG